VKLFKVIIETSSQFSVLGSLFSEEAEDCFLLVPDYLPQISSLCPSL